MGRLSARFHRLPLRVRLVSGFSATMVLVLLAAGAFVYWRVSFALDRQVNEDLTEISQQLTPLVTGSGALQPTAPAVDRSADYQVLDRQGRILTASPTAGPQPLISADDARAALDGPVRRDIGALFALRSHPLRAYAVALPDRGGPAAVLVVAVPRNHRDEALLELLVQLGVAGAGALAITSVVGYLLARSALRPVEAYRSQAAHVIDGAAGVRLAVPDQREDEITRLGNTLNTMLGALEAAVDREREFVRDASHELRTPVTLLTTRVQLALSRPRSTAEHEQILQEIRTDLARLARLSDQLLDGSHPADPNSSTDLFALTRDRVRLRGLVHERPDHLVWASPGPGPLPLALDEIALTQVVDNLISNALVHGAPPVSITADQVGPYARLQVRDSGAGMDAHLLATATHRFTRAPESRTRPGFGLGLALVDRIVAGAGGELRLCHAGEHHCTGHTTAQPCTHGPGMTVTALFPLRPASC